MASLCVALLCAVCVRSLVVSPASGPFFHRSLLSYIVYTHIMHTAPVHVLNVSDHLHAHVRYKWTIPMKTSAMRCGTRYLLILM
jgi:hypothetical protein